MNVGCVMHQIEEISGHKILVIRRRFIGVVFEGVKVSHVSRQ